MLPCLGNLCACRCCTASHRTWSIRCLGSWGLARIYLLRLHCCSWNGYLVGHHDWEGKFWLYLVKRSINFPETNWYHPIVGLTVFALATIQLFGGFLAHILYRKRGRPTIIGTVHVWTGLITITLGMINGGLGLLYNMHVPPRELVPYGILTAIIWVCFVAFVFTVKIKKTRSAQDKEATPESGGVDEDTSKNATEKSTAGEVLPVKT